MLAHNLYFFFFILYCYFKHQGAINFFWKSRLSVCSLEFQKNPLCQVSLGSVKASFSIWLRSSVNRLGLPLPHFSFIKSSTTLDLCLSFLHWSKTVRELEFRMELSPESLIRLICQVVIAFGTLGRIPLDWNLYH